MTISNPLAVVTAEGNGATTSWTYQFLIPTTASCVVQVTDETVDPVTTVTISPNLFTVTGINDPDGGVVNYPLSGSPLSSGQFLSIYRILPLVQDTSLKNQGNLYPRAMEQGLDYLTMITQQLAAAIAQLAADLEIPIPPINPTATYNFDALNDLREYATPALVAGSPVYVQGYTTVGDGGGGTFLITTTNPGPDDNGVNIHLDVAGFYAVRQTPLGIVTPQMFGALANGVASDTAEIQDAVDYVGGIGGGVVFFPEGTYKLTSAVTISDNNVTLLGAGPGSIILDAGNVQCVNVEGAQRTTIRALFFQGTQGTGLRQNNINLSDSTTTIIESCYFVSSSATCIVIDNCDRTFIRDNVALSFFEQFVDIVHPNVDYCLIDGNYANTTVTNSELVSISAIFLGMEAQTDGVYNDIIVTNNTVDFSGMGTPARNNTTGISCNKHAVQTDTFLLKRAVFSGNTFKGMGFGIRLLDTRYGTTSAGMSVIIGNNVFESCRNDAIVIRGGEDSSHYDSAIVAGNIFKGISEATQYTYDGVQLDQNLWHPVVVGNVMQRRVDESGAANFRYGVNVVTTSVIGTVIAANNITNTTASGSYHDASGTAVLESPNNATDINLTADNQVVTVSIFRTITLTSDSVTASNRDFTITPGQYTGQELTLIWSGSNAGQIVDGAGSGAGVVKLSANWAPGADDTLSLYFAGSYWVETGRSNN